MRIQAAAGLGILSISATGLLLIGIGMPYYASVHAAAAVMGMIVGWKSGRPG